MPPYSIIDHTSDVGIEIKADTLEELFSDAVKGLFFLITDKSPEKINESEYETGNIRIKIAYNLIDNALVELLNQIIFFSYTRNILIYKPSITIKKNKIILKAETIENAIPLMVREIKAATYHNFSITNKNGVYSASIVFDI